MSGPENLTKQRVEGNDARLGRGSSTNSHPCEVAIDCYNGVALVCWRPDRDENPIDYRHRGKFPIIEALPQRE